MCLIKSKSLEELNLINNQIDEYESLYSLVKNTKTMKTLNIKENYMNEGIILEFLEALNINISITGLIYDTNRDCEISEELIDKVDKQLTIN